MPRPRKTPVTTPSIRKPVGRPRQTTTATRKPKMTNLPAEPIKTAEKYPVYDPDLKLPSREEMAEAMQNIKEHPQTKDELINRVVEATVNDCDELYDTSEESLSPTAQTPLEIELSVPTDVSDTTPQTAEETIRDISVASARPQVVETQEDVVELKAEFRYLRCNECSSQMTITSWGAECPRCRTRVLGRQR